MAFAPRLRAALKKQGISQAELGRRLGLTSQAVNQWVGTGTTPGLTRVQEIAEVLGVPLSALIGDAEPVAVRSARPTSALAYRIRAVRRCLWPDPGDAASAISLPLPDLEAVEAGAREMPPDALLRFCALAGCPVRFIETGDMAGVRWELVAWLGHTAPDLVPGLLEMGRRPGAKGAKAEDGNEA